MPHPAATSSSGERSRRRHRPGAAVRDPRRARSSGARTDVTDAARAAPRRRASERCRRTDGERAGSPGTSTCPRKAVWVTARLHGDSGRSLYSYENRQPPGHDRGSPVPVPVRGHTVPYGHRPWSARALHPTSHPRDGEVLRRGHGINPRSSTSWARWTSTGTGSGSTSTRRRRSTPTVTVYSACGANVPETRWKRRALESGSPRAARRRGSVHLAVPEEDRRGGPGGGRSGGSVGVPRFGVSTILHPGRVRSHRPPRLPVSRLKVDGDPRRGSARLWPATPKTSTTWRSGSRRAAAGRDRGSLRCWSWRRRSPPRRRRRPGRSSTALPTEQTMGIVAWTKPPPGSGPRTARSRSSRRRR